MSVNILFNAPLAAHIENSISRIKGRENKEDATQEAYADLLSIPCLTLEDACATADRAIERIRNKLRKINRNEFQTGTYFDSDFRDEPRMSRILDKIPGDNRGSPYDPDYYDGGFD